MQPESALAGAIFDFVITMVVVGCLVEGMTTGLITMVGFTVGLTAGFGITAGGITTGFGGTTGGRTTGCVWMTGFDGMITPGGGTLNPGLIIVIVVVYLKTLIELMKIFTPLPSKLLLSSVKVQLLPPNPIFSKSCSLAPNPILIEPIFHFHPIKLIFE